MSVAMRTWRLVCDDDRGAAVCGSVACAQPPSVRDVLYGFWSEGIFTISSRITTDAVCVTSVNEASREIRCTKVDYGPEPELPGVNVVSRLDDTDPDWRDIRRLLESGLVLLLMLLGQGVFSAYFCWLSWRAALEIDVGNWPATAMVRVLAVALPISHFAWVSVWMFRSAIPQYFARRINRDN